MSMRPPQAQANVRSLQRPSGSHSQEYIFAAADPGVATMQPSTIAPLPALSRKDHLRWHLAGGLPDSMGVAGDGARALATDARRGIIGEHSSACSVTAPAAYPTNSKLAHSMYQAYPRPV